MHIAKTLASKHNFIVFLFRVPPDMTSYEQLGGCF